MVVKVALDTNIIVEYLRQNVVVKKHIDNFITSNIFIPVIVLGELYFGANISLKKDKNRKEIDVFCNKLNIIQIDSEIATYYSEIRKKLKELGKPIPENDIWIAASCIAYDLTLLTLDKHFDNIKELKKITII
ncbi:MAG: type II toxin-antitoxin system VapC family toxin [Bacteroidetes bacterium]|nr:MAG: type II toxin-antitoxin system VapC family toxin [Bacteroidota bacterium]